MITSEITTQGNGSTIERSTATGTPEFRILAVNSSGNLTLEETTITGGDISLADLIIYGYDCGAVTIINSTISDNGARYTAGCTIPALSH